MTPTPDNFTYRNQKKNHTAKPSKWKIIHDISKLLAKWKMLFLRSYPIDWQSRPGRQQHCWRRPNFSGVGHWSTGLRNFDGAKGAREATTIEKGALFSPHLPKTTCSGQWCSIIVILCKIVPPSILIGLANNSGRLPCSCALLAGRVTSLAPLFKSVFLVPMA